MRTMDEDPVAMQIDYYRRRAAEYDATAYGDLAAAEPLIARIVAAFHPSGSALEIACGTGLWTTAIAPLVDSLVAIDAAPETIAIARDRLQRNQAQANVRFEVADVFAWTSPDRFDLIFFSAWLSHVPTDRFDAFWNSLAERLAPGGRACFVDEHVDARNKESYLSAGGELVQRQLRDGSTFHIVKNFIDPAQLDRRLAAIGWRCRTWREGDWVCGEARPVTTTPPTN